MKLFANASAFPKVSGVVVSNTIRCFPGTLSIQSSFSWRIGCQFVPEVFCPYAVAVPPATAAAKAAAPALKRERNAFLKVKEKLLHSYAPRFQMETLDSKTGAS